LKAHKMNRRGFTLIEVLLVIAILAMLAGVGIYAFSGTQDKAKVDLTRLLVQTTIPDAIERYKLDIGHVPTEAEGGLEALRKKPAFEDENLAEKWPGAYLKKEPKDAWGNPLNYEVSEDAEEGAPEYKVWSNGKNGTSGDEDDIKNYEEEET